MHAGDWLQWSSSNLQLLSGSGLELGENHRNTLTLTHANGWRYGENFLFIDFIEYDEAGVEAYAEWYPRVSLGKLTGKDVSVGFIKDVSAVAGINVSSEPEDDNFLAFLAGAGFSLDIPGAEFFQLDIMAFKSDDIDTAGVQITPAWSFPFQLGRLDSKFRGFADYLSSGASGGEPYLLTQPQLLLDAGQLLGYSDQIHVGIEYWYWHNKFGIDGVTEHAAQAMLMISFQALPPIPRVLLCQLLISLIPG